MGRSDADRDLLFGALALQAGLIGPGRLAEACQAWAARPDRRLSDILRDRGWLAQDDRDDIERLLRRELDRHGGDAHRALACLADGPLAASLAGADHPGIRADLSELATDPGVASPAPATLDWPAESRDRYPLVRVHARGGLGRIWLARDPVLGRAVALKELLPERADDPTNRARFLAEARITGQLEHPSIVPVYELARCPEDGRPFYTMRLVRGRTLSAAVRDHHARRGVGRGDVLGLSGLLNAFVAACNAIAYAHSRGVIHRDLKGQNIILGDYGEVIVLDWGLAKLVDRPDGEWPEAPVAVDTEAGEAPTLPGRAMGTPGYMAPEQADGRADLIGRPADIYGLGAVLYEILTGRAPFDCSASPEGVRQACERDPSPPRRVRPATPPALESICLKALARRPADRYASATALAEDVRRWLADEPVSARREPAMARWARWARRHRSAMITAGAVMSLGLAALAAGLLAVGRERARAEVHFRLARDEADRIYYRILADPLLERPGMDPLRRELIGAVQEYYRDLAAARPHDPELAEHLGWSYLRLARITSQQGESDRAAELARRGLGTFERLAASHSGVDAYRDDLAHAQFELGAIDRQSGRLPEADAALATAAEIWRQLDARRGRRPRRPELAAAYDERGLVNLGLGRPDRAAELHAAALDIWEDLAGAEGGRDAGPWLLSRLAHSRASMAAVYAAREQWERAEWSYRRARETWEGLLRRRPDESDSRRLAYALEGLGKVYAATGRIAEVRQGLADSVAIWDRLAQEHEAVVEYAAKQAEAHQLLGELDDPTRHAPGDPERAERQYRRALQILEALNARVPPEQRPGVRGRQARALTRLGELARAMGKPELAGSYLRRAREAGSAPEGVGIR